MKKEGVQKVFGTLDLFVSLLETEIKYPILQRGILPFWTPSFSYYPIYPFMIPRLLLRTNMIISSLSLEAGISASILSIASELLRPD